MKKMRFVCVSDTHNAQNEISLPEGDVLLHAGDFTFTGHYPDVAKFNKWLGEQKHKHKIIIAGNHDKTFESSATFTEGLITNATYLRDSFVKVDDLKIWGSPWTPRFGHGWAFNETRGNPIQKRWDLIPDDVDILMTHGPPWKHGDLVTASYSCNRGEHVGCWDLWNALGRVKPLVHVFGHIHEGYGVTTTEHVDGGKTYCVNASTCTENYNPVNKPIVFDVNLKTGGVLFPDLQAIG